MYIPIFVLILFAFNDSPFIVFPMEGFTLKWFAVTLGSTKMLKALWYSLVVALFVTLIAVALGTMGAVCIIRHRFRMRYLLIGLFFSADRHSKDDPGDQLHDHDRIF